MSAFNSAVHLSSASGLSVKSKQPEVKKPVSSPFQSVEKKTRENKDLTNKDQESFAHELTKADQSNKKTDKASSKNARYIVTENEKPLVDKNKKMPDEGLVLINASIPPEKNILSNETIDTQIVENQNLDFDTDKDVKDTTVSEKNKEDQVGLSQDSLKSQNNNQENNIVQLFLPVMSQPGSHSEQHIQPLLMTNDNSSQTAEINIIDSAQMLKAQNNHFRNDQIFPEVQTSNNIEEKATQSNPVAKNPSFLFLDNNPAISIVSQQEAKNQPRIFGINDGEGPENTANQAPEKTYNILATAMHNSEKGVISDENLEFLDQILQSTDIKDIRTASGVEKQAQNLINVVADSQSSQQKQSFLQSEILSQNSPEIPVSDVVAEQKISASNDKLGVKEEIKSVFNKISEKVDHSIQIIKPDIAYTADLSSSFSEQASSVPSNISLSVPTVSQNALPQPGTQAQTIPVIANLPLNALPVEIAMRALTKTSQFEIRLDPKELGGIEVRLDIDDEGGVKTRLVVDRVETLALLQRDSRTLEKAFEQAGLKPSSNGFEFSLRDQNTGQQGQQNSHNQMDQRSNQRNFYHETPLQTINSQENEQPVSILKRYIWREGETGIDMKV